MFRKTPPALLDELPKAFAVELAVAADARGEIGSAEQAGKTRRHSCCLLSNFRGGEMGMCPEDPKRNAADAGIWHVPVDEEEWLVQLTRALCVAHEDANAAKAD